MVDLTRGPATGVAVLPPMPQAPAGSPEWWVTRLYRKLAEDRAAMLLWWRYFVGDHPLVKAPDKVRPRVESAYREILKRANANFMATVIDSASERCRPKGFRLGAEEDFAADQRSWLIWQASMMDADAPLGIETSFAKGRSYLSVWKRDGDDLPTIAVEDPSQTIVEHEPGSRHRRAAALKVYTDEWTGTDRADLFLPGELWRFRRARMDEPSAGGWLPLPGDDEFEPNPLGYQGVPVVPLVNNPRLTQPQLEHRTYLRHGGDSDIADVTPIQDRINETILNRVIAQWFAAFRQRYAAGLVVDEVPVTDDNGDPVLDADGKQLAKPVEPFDAFLDRLWTVDDPNVRFGEFGETDLTKYLRTHERDLQDLSTIKRIPRHYLFQEGQSPSGDAIKSAETGLVARVRRKHLDLGDGFEEAMRIARLMDGEGEAPPDSELVWEDPEFRSYGELVDGVIKEFSAGLVPWEGAMEKLGYSPQQIARFRGQRNMDALLTAMEELEPAGEVAA